MHALVLVCINLYTKLAVPSFTNYKDIYTFIRHEDRIGLQQRLKQTDRHTNKQIPQLIPQHHSNAHNIKKKKEEMI